MRKKIIQCGVASLLMTTAGSALAQQNNAYISGILAGTWQTASRSNVNDEGNAQLYLYGTMDMGPGTWNLEIRGSSTPKTNGVSGYGSNAMVGETTDANGHGRVEATQLFYQLLAAGGQLSFGLMDPTGVFDGNAIANDEYTQFLADAFVNNPTIGFPSFVAGGAFQAQLNDALDYSLFVGSDSGLEEGDHSYQHTFDLDDKHAGHHRGAFTAAELHWHNDQGVSVKGGVWYDTGKVAEIGSPTDTTRGYGVYALASAPLAGGDVNARVGVANDHAMEAANFVSLAYQLPLGASNLDGTLGLAVARTGASDEIAGADPIYQTEVYWRINVAGSLYVSPDVQYIDNAGFDSHNDGVVIGGVRAAVTF